MPPWFTPASVLVLCCVFGLQTAWSVSALLHERRSPYSGGADAARYLRAIGADKGPIACGGYRTNSVLPYFEKNICGNRETAFVHMQRTASGDGESLYMLPRPDYIVIGQAIDYDPNVQLMGELGYTLVHVSPGHIYFRDGIWTSETVFIYRSVQ